jgi:hypothetical protein
MDKRLIGAIEEDPKRKIMRIAVSDELLHRYLNRPTTSGFARNLSQRLLAGERNLLLEVIDLHERVEIAEFDKMGVLKDSLGGASNNPDNEHSHRGYKQANYLAAFEETLFLQRLGKAVLGKDIPYGGIHFAFLSMPQLSRDINPKKAYRLLEFLGRSNLIVPFGCEDILAGVELFRLGGNDPSQVYRALRIAKFVDNFIPSERFSGKLESIKETGLVDSWESFPKLALDLKNVPHVHFDINSFHIDYGDLEKDVFSGHIGYTDYQGQQQNKEWHTRHVTEDENYMQIYRSCGDKVWLFFRDFKERGFAWMSWYMNYKIDAYCAQKLGLETSLIVPRDMATLH